MRDAVVKVHNQTEYHPNGESYQCQYAQLENQIDIDRNRNCWYKWKSRRQECQCISKRITSNENKAIN